MAIGTATTPLVLGNDNPLYKIHLICTGRGINMAVDMPESFSLAMQSEWENRFGANPLGAVGDALRAAGGNVMVQELTRQVWVSSAPMEIPLQLIFDAETSAYYDVYNPMIKMLEFNVPIKQGSLLIAPGPNLGDMSNAVSVRIGRMFFIPDGIVTSVQSQFDTRLDESGFPIGGQIDMTVRTSQVYSNVEWAAATQNDLAWNG